MIILDCTHSKTQLKSNNFLHDYSEIVDGNLKMTLGMIWTIILRFAIQDIAVEGLWFLHILKRSNVASDLV